LSKLIVICPVEDLARAARKSGADAYLQDEKLGRPSLGERFALYRTVQAGDPGD